MSRSVQAGVVAATALLALAAASIAWSVGVALANDITEPDYMVEPIDALVDVWWLVLVVGLVVAAGSFLVLVRVARGGAMVKPGVLAPVMGIGVALGGGYAVVTAPVIGANIGGGMVMMALPVVVVVLAVVAVRAGTS